MDKYSKDLAEMRDRLFGANAGREMPFMGLREIFRVDEEQSNLLQEITFETPIPTLISTAHTAEANLCRYLLAAGSGVDGVALRERIKSSDAAALSLYRGFTKFMREDLAFHPAMRDISKRKQKKLAALIAFEMLKRNQAYSNLVEVLFPFHIRLSIHAHANNGPKFGINLLGRFACRTTGSMLEEMSGSPVDTLHIPTPWHNCVLRVSGKKGWVVVKAKVIREAVMAGVCSAEYIEGEGGSGSYVLIVMADGKVFGQDL